MIQKQRESQAAPHRRPGNSGFSVIELMVVAGLIMVVSAMAIIQYRPIMADADMDAAMRQVIDQIRQAREYSITYRRYVQVSFPTVVATSTQYQVVATQMNSWVPGDGTVNPVLSTTPIQSPATFLLMTGPDTPDAFGNCAAICFGNVSNGPVGGMAFESDGELVNGSTLQPINGTVFLGNPGTASSARAITVLGSTGRVRGWKGTSNSWTQF